MATEPSAVTIVLDDAHAPDRVEDGARTLASAIFARLRADILNCHYQPGEKLLIAPLSRRFNVSLASVREPLSRLVADGLVVAEDQRGFRVSPVSLTDLEDLMQTRIEIECLALRRAIRCGGEDWEARLERAWHDLESVPHTPPGDPGRQNEDWSRLHGRFHAALVDGCELGSLLRFRATLYEQSERYRRLCRAITHGRRDTDGEHKSILEATLDRDADSAASQLASHIERTARAVAEVYRQRDFPEVAP